MLFITPPKDLRTNLEWRAFVRARGEVSARDRARILERCKYDLDFYCDSFVFQYNVLQVGREVGPFILRQRQSEVLKSTSKRLFPENPTNLRHDMIWEKSREEGASWMALILFDHRCLFWLRQKFLCVSHSADAVDGKGKSDSDTLFWKLDFMHSYLPDWIRGEIERVKMSIGFVNTKSAITGASSTGRSGVGGRAHAVLLDELAKQKDAHLILGQTADTGPRLMVSSHYGSGTQFYAQTRRPDVAKEIIHWVDNPQKNAGMYRWDEEGNRLEILNKNHEFPPDYPFVRAPLPTGGPYKHIRSIWYDAECLRRQSPRDVASNIDIDPDASGFQYFDGPTIQHLIKKFCFPPVWVGDLVVRNEKVRLLRRDGGPLRLWIHPKGDSFPVGRYAIGCDIAAGSGSTPSCLAIGDADLGQKVGEYQNANVSPEAYAPIAASVGSLFRDQSGTEAYFCFENAGAVGELFAKKFFATGYSHLYYQETPLKFAGMRERTDKPGWYPRDDAKRALLESYRTALGLNDLINPSKEALEETLKFEFIPGAGVKHAGEKREKEDPTLGRENHGDQTIADALMWMLMQLLGSRKPLEESPKDPAVGSWLWRRAQGEKADQDAELEWA